MREVKFRAWWKNKLRHNAIAGNGQCLFVPSGVGEYTWINLAECKIMQFTGLKDKNGKEIYEGDILLSLVQSMRDNSITKVVGEVYFDEKLGGYMFGNKHSTDKESDTVEFGVCMALSDSVEIIGNIYENPELLSSLFKADA